MSDFHVYEGLVICYPREYCTTWDFCTHYIPHVKGAACSCDSCEPCDFETVVAHKKRIGEKMVAEAVAARDKWWIKTLELNCGDGHDKPLITIGVQEWQDFKEGLNNEYLIE